MPARTRQAVILAASLISTAAIGFSLAFSRPAVAAETAQLAVRIAYIREDIDEPLPLSLVEVVAEDKGIAGARLAIDDNNTTGRFLGHGYELTELTLPTAADFAPLLEQLAADGTALIVADLTAERLIELADRPEAADSLIFNIRAEDDELRVTECRANVFHLIPSRAMKADALAQYLAFKRWSRWVLIHGARDGDRAFADALRRSAKRFGATIVEERLYEFTPGSRRTDTGQQQVQRQMIELTQRLPEHDVLVVSDENEVFGDYLPYRTWDPRPVVGTQGLVPTAWHRSQEQWGGTQLQRRFEGAAGRWMLERDYAGWAAIRSVGEAVTRTGSADAASIREYILSEAFQLGGFKGVGLTFRRWNQQLRQPVLLASPLMLVSVSPQEGFLNPRTPLDTLGFDEPESECRLNE